MGRLEKRVAVVTGAASGIGAATARRFIEEGAAVIVADLQVEAGAAVAASLGDQAIFVRANVTLEDDVSRVVQEAMRRFGKLDIMVNNAGIVGATGSILETSREDWSRTLDVLLNGTFYGMKHAGRVMKPAGRGCILSVASVAGVAGGLGPHAYTAAKHAVVGLTKSVASELAHSGIRVNCVAPGSMVTAMTAEVITGDVANREETERALASTSALGIAGAPEDVANALLYLASDDARFVTGHALVVDAGMTTGGSGPSFHSQEQKMIGLRQ